MKFFQTKTAALVSDVICCALLGTAIGAMLFSSLGLEAGFGICLLMIVADLLLVVLLTRKWWVFPAFITGALSLAAITAAVFDIGAMMLDSVANFFAWFAAGFPNAAEMTNGSVMTAQFLIALPLAAALFLFIRRLFLFAAVPLFSIGWVVWAYLSRSDDSTAILILLLGAVFICMAKASGNRVNRQLSVSDRVPTILLETAAIVIMSVVLLLTLALAPKADGDLQSKALVNIVEDVSDLLSNRESSTESTYRISSSGFSPLGNRLGGDVTLSHETTMRVMTDTPIRLTGAVFDTYDGSNWYDGTPLRRYRFSSILWRNQRHAVFGLDKPYGGRLANDLYAKLSKPAELEIASNVRGISLFAAGQVESLEGMGFETSDIFFNEQSELCMARSNTRTVRYQLRTTVFDRYAADFDENMRALEAITMQQPDSYFDMIKPVYVQLPESLPNEVFEAAENIIAGCSSPFDKALAIEQWLTENCTYTLTPGNPPADSDFAAHFLDTREGYCVYFASAMTVLARCADLPARYVTGFALKRSPSGAKGSYIATNATAHAWTEIYFQGIGWVPFDATGWDFDEIAQTDDTDAATGSQSTYTPAPTGQPEQDVYTGIQGEGSAPFELLTGLFSLLCLFVLIVLFICIRSIVLMRSAESLFRHLCRRCADESSRLDACYKRVIGQTAYLGILQSPSDTITSLADRVDKLLDETAMTMACKPVIRMRFGLKPPSDADVMSLCVFSACLERRLYTHLKLPAYLWYRVLLGRYKKV